MLTETVPEVKEVQSSHGLQDRKLFHQQFEDHGDPLDPAHHLQHVSLITNLWTKSTFLHF